MKFYDTYLLIFRRGLRRVKLASAESVVHLQDKINLLSERLDALETPTEPEVPEDVPIPPVVPVPPMVPDEPTMDEPDEPQPGEPIEPAPEVPEEEPTDPVEEPETPEEPQTPENPPTEEPTEPVDPETPENTPTEPEAPSEPKTLTPEPRGLRWTKVDRGEAISVKVLFENSPFEDDVLLSEVQDILKEVEDICSATFELSTSGQSDIDVFFENIDGRGRILGQVALPTRGINVEACACGDVQLDSSENLSLVNWSNVMRHEFCHFLGCDHLDESEGESLMNPFFRSSNRRVELAQDEYIVSELQLRYPV